MYYEDPFSASTDGNGNASIQLGPLEDPRLYFFGFGFLTVGATQATAIVYDKTQTWPIAAGSGLVLSLGPMLIRPGDWRVVKVTNGPKNTSISGALIGDVAQSEAALAIRPQPSQAGLLANVPGLGGGASLIAKLAEIAPLTVAQATLDLTPLAGTSKHILAVFQGRSTANQSGGDQLLISLNNDNGANYNFESVEAFGSTITAAETSNATAFNQSANRMAIPAALDTANSAAQLQMFIALYAQLNFFKNVQIEHTPGHTGAANLYRANSIWGYWASNAAVTRITFSLLAGGALFDVGSYAAVYGIG